jgi:hydrogenase nickel incorporation protein HypA/HybF
VHEYSIARALIERVAAEARARRAVAVGRVSISVGELSGIDVELLQEAYRTLGERSVCERAPLVIESVPVEWTCRECGAAIAPGDVLSCTACGGAAVLRHGGEMLLERIDMEVP